MREIKFRGKSKFTGKWHYGYYHFGFMYPNSNPNDYINNEIINPETVGQYTGAKDIKEVEIYEGDITSNGTVILWDNKKHLFAEYYKNKLSGNYTIACIPADFSRVSIIGNIHDNPELLK